MRTYIYTIFDSNPAESGNVSWPTHTNVEFEAISAAGAVAQVQSVLEVEAVGLHPCDGYSHGDKLHSIVWNEHGAVVDELTEEVQIVDLN